MPSTTLSPLGSSPRRQDATSPLEDAHPHGVMFHHFHDGGLHAPSQGSIDAGTLDALLEFVGIHRVLSAHEWVRRAASQSLQPGDLCLTFDDALRCQMDVALPVLRARGLTAFWFVYTSVMEGTPEPLEIYRHFRGTAYDSINAFYAEFIAAAEQGATGPDVRRALERFDPASFLSQYSSYTDDDRRFRFLRDEVLGGALYDETMRSLMDARGFDAARVLDALWLTNGDLRLLASEGHVVGMHSHTHPMRLAELTPSQQRAEYENNSAHLCRVLGAAPGTMSHPCNSYGAETLALLQSLGVRLGFRANMFQPDYSSLEHPREDHSQIVRRMHPR